jgi:hypothetical protein
LATDKPFYKLAIDHPAAVLKLLGVSDYDDYTAGSFTFKATENRRDLVFKKGPARRFCLSNRMGTPIRMFIMACSMA